MEQFVFAFFGGFLSFVSPCVLPLVPAYISFMSEVSVEELSNRESGAQFIPRVFISSLLFVAGFSLVFVLLGASATVFGRLISGHMDVLRKLAGIVLIIFGLNFIGLFKIGFLNYEKRLQVNTRQMSGARALVMGVVFAFGWTPCIGPILAGILAIASTQESVRLGIMLLFVYAMGLGIPFILTGLATGWSMNFFDKIKKHFRAVEITSGLLLVAIGIMIFMNRLGMLSGFFMELFPFLSRYG
ncbi:MAG: cytochrome c biogenesis protein CcdA [bacterium]|nr:cytochrome c biogenesis protein CcdA [bacterium]